MLADTVPQHGDDASRQRYCTKKTWFYFIFIFIQLCRLFLYYLYFLFTVLEHLIFVFVHDALQRN